MDIHSGDESGPTVLDCCAFVNKDALSVCNVSWRYDIVFIHSNLWPICILEFLWFIKFLIETEKVQIIHQRHKEVLKETRDKDR